MKNEGLFIDDHYSLIIGYWALIYVQNSSIMDFLRTVHEKLCHGGIFIFVENILGPSELKVKARSGCKTKHAYSSSTTSPV